MTNTFEPAAPEVAIATDIGHVRMNNEDFALAGRVIRDGGSFSIWVVADGVGGGPSGELASRTAVETVIQVLTGTPWDDPAKALAEAIGAANRRVFEITGDGAACTTVVAALLADGNGPICIANVGDSRAYVVAAGQARPVTDDHNVAATRVAAGRISAAEARTAPDRNLLTRAVGSDRELTVDLFDLPRLLPGERLVLCSDGVHGMIDDDEIGHVACAGSIDESAAALVEAALDAGGLDNATALVGGYAHLAGCTEEDDPA